MKVAIVTPVFPPYKGGIGTVASQEERLLTGKGFSVSVFSPLSNLKPWFSIGKGAFVPGLIWRLKDFDVIHLHYPFFGGDIFAALAALIWKKRLVITVHMKAEARDYREFIFRFYRLIFESLIFRPASVLAVSTFDYAQSAFSNKLGERWVEVPFGVNVDRFSAKETYSHSLPVKFLFVGGLDKAHYFKGLDCLLQACALLGNDSPWQLSIVGSGDQKVVFEKKVVELGLRNKITFLGSVPFSELPQVYRRHDVHILPSVNSAEAYGLVTLEAGASGLPSIVTNLPGVRTLVQDRETGRVVAVNDPVDLSAAMTEFITSPETIATFGQNARKRVVANFSEESEVSQLLKILSPQN